MDMDIAMVLHVVLAIFAFALMAVLLTGLALLTRAESVAQMRAWAPIVNWIEIALPLTALGLVATGVWLVQLAGEEMSWGDGWVVVSLAAVFGAVVMGRAFGGRTDEVVAALRDAPDGPVPDDLRRRVAHPAIRWVPNLLTADLLGIVVIMVVKPSAAASILTMGVALVVGAAATVALNRSTHPATSLPGTPAHPS